MTRIIIFTLSLVLTSFATSKSPNVLLLCIDDLRPELKCFGADYIHSPNIDKLAARGRAFTRHYVQAPTCGSSRFALLTGRYGPADNGALFKRSKSIPHPSLPSYFRQNGYTTVSVGKVSHHPGGRGGKRWAEDDKLEMPESWDRHLQPVGAWGDPEGIMHGLANGEIRKKAGDMALIQAVEGGDEIYPDGLITETGLEQLEILAKDEKPFFLAVGIIRPHLPFGAPKKYLDLYEGVDLPPIPHPEKPKGKTTWHGSGEFMKYQRWGKNPNKDAEFADDVRRHYAACVSYADAQVGRVLDRLEELGLQDDTIVVLWGDHGWHLGEYAIWGKHSLYEESLHAPLIIATPGLASAGEATVAVVESVDLFPTLCDLAKLPAPIFVDGISLNPQLEDAKLPTKRPAFSYFRSASTLRDDRYRFILHKDGATELYDFSDPKTSFKNVAKDQPEVTERLRKVLELMELPRSLPD